MMDIEEITIEEFKKDIYNRYIQIFPRVERREWTKIELSYQKNKEKFYKIVVKDVIIGFFMLEKLDKAHPYYLEYFAIFDEFQNQGYGSKALQILIDKKVKDEDLIAEMDKVDKNDLNTVRRSKFYEKLGFKKIDSEYLLYKAFYTPIVYTKSNEIIKEKYDKIFFDYYNYNCGENSIKANCRIIK